MALVLIGDESAHHFFADSVQFGQKAQHHHPSLEYGFFTSYNSSQIMGSKQELTTIGGLLFSKPGLTREAFSEAWHRHAQLATPWFLHHGIAEYTQIHLPEGAQPGSPSPLTHDAAARRALAVAGGVAIVRFAAPTAPSFMDLNHPYFQAVIAPDERRFLHDESGATAVVRDPPAFPVPPFSVEEWRALALEMGGVEAVKIQHGKPAIEGVWWEEWQKYA